MNILVTSVGSAPCSAITRSLQNQSNYNMIGIDIQELCIGNFICDKFIVCPKVNDISYKLFIENIIHENKITKIFVGCAELEFFSKYKKEYKEKLNCDIFVNDQNFIDIANNKNKTYDFCINNDINIPKKCDISYRPCIAKPINGYGSIGLKILKTVEDQDIVVDDSFIIQEFIEGEEYTVDILSDIDGNFIVAVPKKRLLVKNGQSFKSIVCKDDSVISFCRDVCEKMNNKSAINIQVIKQKNTGKIFLIEINPRFATTINLSIEAGVHIPKMMLENNYIKCDYEDDLVMVRDYKEYFVSNKCIPSNKINMYNIISRDCLIDTHEQNITSSNFDKFVYEKLRENIDNFLLKLEKYIFDKKNIIEIGVYWGKYKGAKQLYPNLNIKSADIDKSLNPDHIIDITKKTHFDDCEFDSIICLEVLEHTRNPIDAVKEMTRLLVSGGLLILSMPCNYRIHAPFPDSWRFTHHFFKVIAEDFGYKILLLDCIEDSSRYLFPIHYTCILQKL